MSGASASASPAASPPVRLRPATADDVTAMAAIEANAFSDPWPASAFRALLEGGPAAVTVATDPHGEVVGYTVVMVAGLEGDLANIACAAAWRGRGVGDCLLAGVLADARSRGVASLFLEVREGNTPARSLYAKHGFLPVGRRRRYYQHPLEDALVLRRDLAPPADRPPADDPASP